MVGWWDLFIAVAYFAIPLELVYCFLWYPFPIRAGPAVIVILFVSFITLCGGTHLVRAFGWAPAIPIVTAICTVISVLTAVMLLWLIPGVFKLAKKLEEERTEKMAMETFEAALTEAVEAPEDRKASLNLIRTIPFCSNRQLRLLTTARSSLARMLGSSTVEITSVDDQKSILPTNRAVVPINQLIVIVVNSDVYEAHRELLERVSVQIAKLFREAGDMILG